MFLSVKYFFTTRAKRIDAVIASNGLILIVTHCFNRAIEIVIMHVLQWLKLLGNVYNMLFLQTEYTTFFGIRIKWKFFN
ncbi:hypothetical protein OA93_19970 [Flavobacterium sp. KMS]|nr:hypothetical protein OA93_19970 [Flavobacterium sp. KMS]